MVALVPKLKNYSLGQSVTVKIQIKLHDGKLRRTDMYLNDKMLTTNDQTEFEFSITRLEVIGINTLRVVSEKTDGISTTRIFNFTVLSDVKPKIYTYKVIREYPHSTDHFTQGLEVNGGFLYEGTGENGKSSLYKMNITTGKIFLSKPLEDKYFGEGITILNNKIYQLTYKHQIGFVYNLSDFAVVDSFRFHSAEGWGLTNDGKFLIMSDGTETLTWIDPENYKVMKKTQVADNENIYKNLNELEYDNGNIWANIWMTNKIVCIDAEKGNIKGIIDLGGIMSVMSQDQEERIDVLNGIAFDPQSGNMLVTGKLWPKIYEIKVNISE
jgi:glutamine cyclotransferase